jgi:hypothetical protein
MTVIASAYSTGAWRVAAITAPPGRRTPVSGNARHRIREAAAGGAARGPRAAPGGIREVSNARHRLSQESDVSTRVDTSLTMMPNAIARLTSDHSPGRLNPRCLMDPSRIGSSR